MMSGKELFNAFYYANRAALELNAASVLTDNSKPADPYLQHGLDQLRKAAEALGFDLVEKPLTVISKHDFMERVRRATATDGMKQDANGNLYQRD